MRILFVGNSNSFLLIHLALRLKKAIPGLVIDVLSEVEVCSEFSKSAFDSIYFIEEKSPLRNKKIIKFFWYAKRMKGIVKSLPAKYDVVHILYLSSVYRMFWKDLKDLGRKTVITIFGSEFYRSNRWVKLLQKKMVKEADIVSATNPITLKDFKDKFNVPANKERLCRFGLSILDEIDLVTKEEIDSFKVSQGISKEEKIIVCGYNSSVNQNHEAMIDALFVKKDQLSNAVLFLQLPNAYANPYCKRVIEKLDSTCMNYRIFDKYFTDHELAIYRCAADVMIQVQNFDQFSGAMTEHIYAGSKVITGSWLPYEVLDRARTDYFKVSAIPDISHIIEMVVNAAINKVHNKKVIGELCSWDENIDSWLDLYK